MSCCILNPDAIAEPGAVTLCCSACKLLKPTPPAALCWKATASRSRFCLSPSANSGSAGFRGTAGQSALAGQSGEPPLSLPRRRLFAATGGRTACRSLSGRDSHRWEKLGGFDEQFFPVWFEDVDLCKRLLDHGDKIFYCPGARFHHSGAHSVGQLSFRDKQLFWYGNMLRYARKHFSAMAGFRSAAGDHQRNAASLAGSFVRRATGSAGGHPGGLLGGSAKDMLKLIDGGKQNPALSGGILGRQPKRFRLQSRPPTPSPSRRSFAGRPSLPASA